MVNRVILIWCSQKDIHIPEFSGFLKPKITGVSTVNRVLFQVVDFVMEQLGLSDKAESLAFHLLDDKSLN